MMPLSEQFGERETLNEKTMVEPRNPVFVSDTPAEACAIIAALADFLADAQTDNDSMGRALLCEIIRDSLLVLSKKLEQK